MKKKIILVLVMTCLVTACGKVPKLANGEEAIVSFDNTNLSISADDLYNELKDKYALTALIDMIDRKILLDVYPDDADKAKDYADNEIEGIKTYFVDDDGNYDESQFINYLNQYYGLNTVAAFEELLNLSYYRNLAIKDYAKKQITDKQINDYYKNDLVGDIECSHILIGLDITDDATEAEKKTAEEAALKKAKNIIKELNDGADFAELAKKYSTDSSNASDGGKLGYFNKGDMVSEFETAAYALKLNAYTKEPVKTKFGYHIILKTGEKEKAKLEDAKEEIITTLSDKLLTDDAKVSVNALIELRKEYGIKIEDSNLNSNYSKVINNQILNAQNQNNSN